MSGGEIGTNCVILFAGTTRRASENLSEEYAWCPRMVANANPANLDEATLQLIQES
jgi:hypothetical protein